MTYTDDYAELASDSFARWQMLLPVVPKNCDLRAHLEERRSIAEVMAKRRMLMEAVASATRSANVIAFPKRDAMHYENEHRLAS